MFDVSIRQEIIAQGGLAPTHRLKKRGWTGFSLARSVSSGSIIRVRKGWYALPEEKSQRLEAARVGGRLTCSAGAADWGLWTRTATPPLHVAVRPDASRLRDPRDYRKRMSANGDATIHWVGPRRGTAFVVDPLSCLLDMTRCEPLESVVAAADCALRLGLVTRRQWASAIANLPARMRVQLAAVDPASGSYWESIVRFRLGRIGIRTQTQVQLGPKLRVDFLIGRHLVVEIDGRQHAEFAQHEVDRVRDAELSALGCRCLRFTPRQVNRSWSTVRAAIDASISRGDSS